MLRGGDTEFGSESISTKAESVEKREAREGC